MDNQELYIVNPEQLKFAFVEKPLQWRRDQLRTRLRSSASLWATLRTRSGYLLRVLNEIGEAIGKGQELADHTFENSPFNTLPLNSTDEYDPFFAYFPPTMVSEYLKLFEALPSNFTHSLAKWENNGIAERTLYAFTLAFREAHSRHYAVAVDHC